MTTLAGVFPDRDCAFPGWANAQKILDHDWSRYPDCKFRGPVANHGLFEFLEGPMRQYVESGGYALTDLLVLVEYSY